MERAANLWDESIEKLHCVSSSITLKTDATRIENFLAMVQVASDNAQKYNETHLASLHMLESAEPILKATLAAIDRLAIRQAELDLEEAIREMRNYK